MAQQQQQRPSLRADIGESSPSQEDPPDDSRKPGLVLRKPSAQELRSWQADRGMASFNPLYAQYLSGVRG